MKEFIKMLFPWGIIFDFKFADVEIKLKEIPASRLQDYDWEVVSDLEKWQNEEDAT